MELLDFLHKNEPGKQSELLRKGKYEQDAGNAIMDLDIGMGKVHEMPDTSSIGQKHKYEQAGG